MFTLGETVLSTLAAGSLLGCGWLALEWRTQRRLLAQAVRLQKVAQASENTAMRQIRLTSQQLREIGLNLNGAAEHLGAGGSLDAAIIAGTSASVFDVADCMHEFTMKGDRDIKVNLEQIDVSFIVDQVVGSLKQSNALGRRMWHVSPDLSQAWLLSDARALRHVLSRSLIIVLCGTKRDDRIEIRAEPRGAFAALVIEGVPLDAAADQEVAGVAPNARQLLPRMTLTKQLVDAHGGELHITQPEGKGPKVTMSFPANLFSLSGPVAGQAQAATQPARKAFAFIDERQPADALAV